VRARVQAVHFEVNLFKFILHSNYLTILHNFIISHDFVSTCHKAGQRYHLKILHPKPKMGSDFSLSKLKTPLFHFGLEVKDLQGMALAFMAG
jgi:hypothetical protein